MVQPHGACVGAASSLADLWPKKRNKTAKLTHYAFNDFHDYTVAVIIFIIGLTSLIVSL